MIFVWTKYIRFKDFEWMMIIIIIIAYFLQVSDRPVSTHWVYLFLHHCCIQCLNNLQHSSSTRKTLKQKQNFSFYCIFQKKQQRNRTTKQIRSMQLKEKKGEEMTQHKNAFDAMRSSGRNLLNQNCIRIHFWKDRLPLAILEPVTIVKYLHLKRCLFSIPFGLTKRNSLFSGDS